MSGMIEETTYKAFKMRGEAFREHVPYVQQSSLIEDELCWILYKKKQRILEKEQAKWQPESDHKSIKAWLRLNIENINRSCLFAH